jgi:glycosyltransferase involved in cell wall biosynthesis
VHEVQVPDGRYYQLKNEGARRARGEIILFLDSDVLPEAGWLRQLLATFDDPKVQVAVGNAHVDPTGLYGRIFALAWYFPSRSADGPPAVSGTSMVNNIAMRRSVFDRHPFPDDPTLYIGQCVSWSETLRGNGIDIYLNPSARVAHPPPRFFRSALINGHDAGRRLRRPGDSRKHAWRAAGAGLRAHLAAARSRIAAERREVGLSRAGVPVALAVGGAYWLLWALAEAVSRWNPDLIRRRYGG